MSFLIHPGPYIPPSYLEDPPLVPNPYDDEFDSAVLDASWTRVGTFDDVNAIDPYIGFSTGARSSLHSLRPSWVMVQPGPTGSIKYQKLITFPTDCFAWCRASFCVRHASQINSDSDVGMSFSDSDAGTNVVSIYLNDCNSNTFNVLAHKVTAGVSADIGTTDNMGGVNTTKAQAFCFVGLQKLGTTYHFWAATENGAWQWIGNTTHATEFTRVHLVAFNTSQTSPGNMVMGFDFFRFKSGIYLP